MKSHAAGIPAVDVRILTASPQPICLIGPNRAGRIAAIADLHRAWFGQPLDPASPHPDLSFLAPGGTDPAAPGGGSIGIDAVREFVERLCLTPYAADVRLGVIEPAGALTVESQNALLRFIEEPSASSRIILSTRRTEELLPTLLSRCRTVRLKTGMSADELSELASPEDVKVRDAARALFDVLNNPDGVERLVEFKLAKHALDLYEAVRAGGRIDGRVTKAFSDKTLPSGETSLLFSEIVMAAVCARVRDGAEDAALAERLLELQSKLRYHPPRALVLAAIEEWLEPARTVI